VTDKGGTVRMELSANCSRVLDDDGGYDDCDEKRMWIPAARALRVAL